MLSAQSALTAANIPGYRGAFVSTPDLPDPPDCYCAYTYTRTPAWASDDGARAVRIRAFLHLFCRGDPTQAMDALRGALADQGFAPVSEIEGYENNMGYYETLIEVEGCANAAEL